MPTFHIRVVNSDFESGSEVEAPNFERARQMGLRAALRLGSDEVDKGAAFFGAEVRVELDGELKERFVVSIGQSPLK